MNLNYAIFRSEPIYTLNDLAQIGSHNKREKHAYNSNPDIDINKSKDNIELVPLTEKYVKGFKMLVKDYEKEFNEKQKTVREDRKRTFNQMLNKSQNVVADELLFTATNTFFKNMEKEDILEWANTCMDFVYNDLGYTKEQVLHATIHLDEKTPHIHCVVVPLVKKFDKRTNTERYTISKKQFIRDKIHLSELQDKYHARLIDAGYDLERGIKGSDRKHIKMKDYKAINNKLEQNLTIRNEKLENALNEFEENMKTTKNTLIDKDYVKIKKETFDSMNKVVKESKKVMELQPKIKQVFNDVSDYSISYNSLERENDNMKREIKSLITRNQKLKNEIEQLKRKIELIFIKLKEHLRELLQYGNEKVKEIASKQILNYFINDDITKRDVFNISRGTTKEVEICEAAEIPGYYKAPNKILEKQEIKEHTKRQDYEISL